MVITLGTFYEIDSSDIIMLFFAKRYGRIEFDALLDGIFFKVKRFVKYATVITSIYLRKLETTFALISKIYL